MKTLNSKNTDHFVTGFTASYIYDNPFHHKVAKPVALRQLDSIGSIAKLASEDYATFIGAVTYDCTCSTTSTQLHLEPEVWADETLQTAVFFEMEKWVVWENGRILRDRDGEVVRKQGYHEHLISFVNQMLVAA